MKVIEVPESMMKHVIPFVQEACEMIDAEYGQQRTFDDMVEDGVVVEGVTEFVAKFHRYKVWTQAQANKKLVEDEASKQQDLKDERDGIVAVEVLD